MFNLIKQANNPLGDLVARLGDPHIHELLTRFYNLMRVV